MFRFNTRIMAPLFAVLAFAGTWISSASALTISDNFTDGEYTNNPAWTVNAGGPWDASSGVLNQTGFGGPYGNEVGVQTPWTIQLDGVSSDGTYTFQSDVGIPFGAGGYSVGLAFHIQDSQNLEAFVIFPGYPGGELRQIHWVNGIGTILSFTNMGFTPPLGPGQFSTMQLQLTGSSATISVKNGTGGPPFDFTQTFTDATFTGGGVGLISQGGVGFFDNVVFTVPEPASAALVTFGGLAILRRRRGR